MIGRIRRGVRAFPRSRRCRRPLFRQHLASPAHRIGKAGQLRRSHFHRRRAGRRAVRQIVGSHPNRRLSADARAASDRSHRHCEEQSDEAIPGKPRVASPLGCFAALARPDLRRPDSIIFNASSTGRGLRIRSARTAVVRSRLHATTAATRLRWSRSATKSCRSRSPLTTSSSHLSAWPRYSKFWP